MSTKNGLVQRLRSHCNVLRDDGLSYGDYLEQLTHPPTGMLGVVFREARNRIQDPAKLRRLVGDLSTASSG